MNHTIPKCDKEILICKHREEWEQCNGIPSFIRSARQTAAEWKVIVDIITNCLSVRPVSALLPRSSLQAAGCWCSTYTRRHQAPQKHLIETGRLRCGHWLGEVMELRDNITTCCNLENFDLESSTPAHNNSDNVTDRSKSIYIFLKLFLKGLKYNRGTRRNIRSERTISIFSRK